ncbi:MAG: serine/threonine protein kinase [Bifidobacteriaceae bacterium]|nr:serine/threonine protein kinase [Bifidobacteriaceae bacterium]
MAAFQTGVELVGGRYRLDSEFTRGGQAQLYKGTDLRKGQPVILKTPLSANDPAVRQRFQAEAAAGAAASHPALVHVLDLVESPEMIWLVMEQADGQTLTSWVAEHGAFCFTTVLPALAQIAAGLQALHRSGLIHRDVSPTNILFDGQQARLIDFGIALPIGSPPLTADLKVPGNPAYLAPELALGRNAQPSADLYSLGLVLLFCLTGQAPFTADTPEDIAVAQVMGAAPTPPPGIPVGLHHLIVQMTAKDPDKRPSNIGVVGRCLADLATANPAHPSDCGSS